MFPELNTILLGMFVILFGVLNYIFWVKPMMSFIIRNPSEIKPDETQPEYMKNEKHPESVYHDGQYVQLLGKVDIGTPEWTRYVEYVKQKAPDLQDKSYTKPCSKFLGILKPRHDMARIGYVPNYRRHEIYTCRKCGYTEAGWGASGIYYENYFQHVGYVDPSRERVYEHIYHGSKSKPRKMD